MRFSPRIRRRALVAAIAAGAVAAAAAVVWREAGERASWRAALTGAPDLGGWPEEFRRRVAEAHERAAHRDIAALAELARLYEANGFVGEASRAYGALMRSDARNPRWPHALAGIHAGYGRLEEALPLMEKTVALAPDHLPARLRLGDVLLKTNHASAAAEAYAAALAREPANPYALLGLARCDLQSGRWTSAREHLQQAAAAAPEFSAACDLLATVHERLGNPGAAATARERARRAGRFRDPPDPWHDELLEACFDVYRLRVAAASAAAAGDRAMAVRWLERAAALAPDEARVQRQLGNLHGDLREFAKARAHLERSIALAPGEDAAYLDLLGVLQASGGSAGAEALLEAGIARCPRSAALFFERGRRRAAAGRTAEAVADLRESCRLQGDRPEAHLELARTLFQLGQTGDGAAELQAALTANPAHVATLLALARFSVASGDEAAAQQWLARARDAGAAGAEEHAAGRDFERRFGHPP